jgi:hypothetical protein
MPRDSRSAESVQCPYQPGFWIRAAKKGQVVQRLGSNVTSRNTGCPASKPATADGLVSRI